MTNPNTAPSADSDGGAIDDPFTQARLMRWGKALQAEGNSLGDALVAFADSWSQDWAEAVAPEAKPDAWQSRWYNSDPAHARVGWSEWTQLSQQAGESLQDAARRWRGRICDTFEIRPLFAAPPAPPAPLPAEVEKDAARYRHLRDRCNDHQHEAPMVLMYEKDSDEGDRPYWVIAGAVLDESVDAAITAAKEQTK